MSVLGCRSVSRSKGTSAKFELTLTTRCQYLGVDLPADLGVDQQIGTHLNWSWPWDVQYLRGLISQQIQQVDLPYLNSSWPQDVCTRGSDMKADLGGRSCQMWNSYWSYKMISTGGIDTIFQGRSASIVDLPNLNSSWPWDVHTRGVVLPADLGIDLPNLNSSWPWDVSTRGVDLPNLNSSWPQDISTGV